MQTVHQEVPTARMHLSEREVSSILNQRWLETEAEQDTNR